MFSKTEIDHIKKARELLKTNNKDNVCLGILLLNNIPRMDDWIITKEIVQSLVDLSDPQNTQTIHIGDYKVMLSNRRKSLGHYECIQDVLDKPIDFSVGIVVSFDSQIKRNSTTLYFRDSLIAEFLKMIKPIVEFIIYESKKPFIHD